MKTKEELREEMVQQGFTVINEYDDEPNEFFAEHNHPGDQLLIVLEGSIEITMSGSTILLEPGDQLFFPAGVMHSATVGPKGCLYLDGERPNVTESE